MVDAAKARVAPVSSAMLYGRGVFTTVAVYDGNPFLWNEHWERLKTNAERLGINHEGCTEHSVGEALKKLASVNRVNAGRARVVLLARNSPGFWKTKRTVGRKTDLLITTSNQQQVRETGISLAVSPYRVNTSSPVVGIKTLNYLERVLAWEETQSRQFDEAVMLNERGEVVSATMANIFWVKEGTIHTPALATGAYDGVTRAAVLNLAEKQFIPVLEGVYDMADLTEAEEIFLTSSSLGLAIVTTFDFRQYGVTQESVAARLRSELKALIAAAEEFQAAVRRPR